MNWCIWVSWVDTEAVAASQTAVEVNRVAESRCRMKVYYFTRTYNSYGPGDTHAYVGYFIERAINGDALGISELSVFANYKTGLPPRPSLEKMHQEFHQGLGALPKTRYERKKGRLTIEFESQLGSAEEIIGVYSDTLFGSAEQNEQAARYPLREGPDPRLFRAALTELNRVLRTSEPRLRGKPGLNFSLFLDEMERVPASLPASDDELVRLCHLYEAEQRAAVAAAPWWKQLEIDWDEFHPNAKALLDDAFYWSGTDDNAPHGNDTGSDLFADFRKWRAKNRRASPLTFLDKLLRSWGFGDKATSDDASALPEETIELAHHEADIALAFALIKLEGTCDASVRRRALDAIERQMSSHLSERWVSPEERLAALKKMHEKLMEFAAL